MGGFSFVNTALAFDTNILLNEPDKKKDLIELNIDGKNRLKRSHPKS